MVLKMKANISNTCYFVPRDGDTGARWVNNKKMSFQFKNND